MTTIARLEQAIANLTARRKAPPDTIVLDAVTIEAALNALQQQLRTLKRRQLATERRQVTVMFADISGFTAMSEKLDPEEVRNMINACFERLAAVILRYNGYIDKFIGDEIMALFGAPVAHENDPERALRAALDMMTALEEFNAEHAGVIPKPLALHFGINTGLVIAGGIGIANRQDYSVMGDAVNLASRLEGLSEAGEILVGESTYRLTTPLFEFYPLKPVKVKGKEKPVQVHCLLKAKAVLAGQMRGIEGLTSPLVGRDADFELLKNAYQKLFNGQGSLISLIGDAGLGKTRLVSELQNAELSAQTCWAKGQAVSYGENAGYLLARSLFHSLLGLGLNAAPAEIAQTLQAEIKRLLPRQFEDVFPYLAHLLEASMRSNLAQRVKYLSGNALHQRILQASQDYIQAKAQELPLILVCDDLHWADPSSLSLIQSLLPLVHRHPLLICLLYRPLKQSTIWAFHETVSQEMNGDFSVIQLGPLSDEDACQMVNNLLTPCDLPKKISNLIAVKAEGNPFYIEEVIRSLIDAQTLSRSTDTGQWIANADIDDITIPDTLQGVVMSRIDHLDLETKHILQIASVIGRNFPYKLLNRIVENKN